ncbi:MAG: pantoate--beta-alanine ligase [Candidatus Humimicrobiaceae bacterium]
MEIIRTKDEMKAVSAKLKSEGRTLGLVPTMGYLHEGHVSLIKSSKKECDTTAVSIFVNPIQFGPGEDFNNYPRDTQRDAEIASKEKVDFVFIPEEKEMYDENHLSYVHVEKLDNIMCGKFRENHFRGVCTVVLKLFNIVKPDYAFFGEKDFQQLVIIKKMVKDLDVNVKIIGCETIRETDGLAMSSRNKYLTEKERKNAVILHNTILFAEEEIKKRYKDPEEIKKECLKILNLSEFVKKVDYFDLRDPETLEELKSIKSSPFNVLIAAAVYMGTTRLIDNKVVLL